ADPERWLFCRADMEYTQRVAKGMKVFLSLKGHQDYLILIDKKGKIRTVIDGTSGSECDRFHKLLLECLAEDAPDDKATDDNAAGEKASTDKPSAEKGSADNAPVNKPAAEAAKENTP